MTDADPTVAAFDFDGTLTNGGSVARFLAAVAGPGRVAAAAAALAPSLVAGALLGGTHADDAKEHLFRAVLEGRDAADVAACARRFGPAHYRRHARAVVRDRLEWHRGHGHRLLVVSASPELYVDPVGEELGVDAVVATRLAVGPDGTLTGGYEGRNCRGEEKLRRVRAWVDEHVERAPGTSVRLWAYGNSRGDLGLLGAADVAVNAGRLGRLGRLRRYTPLAGLGGDCHPPS